jgi:hypothetical protein
MTYRVEITRDETRASGGVGVEITAYIDRVPETNEAGVGRLTRAPKGVWNSRLLFSGDFDSLAEALAAVEAAYPDIADIACNEWSVDSETPLEMPPLHRSAEGKWLPGKRPSRGPPPHLDWRIGEH